MNALILAIFTIFTSHTDTVVDDFYEQQTANGGI